MVKHRIIPIPPSHCSTPLKFLENPCNVTGSKTSKHSTNHLGGNEAEGSKGQSASLRLRSVEGSTTRGSSYGGGSSNTSGTSSNSGSKRPPSMASSCCGTKKQKLNGNYANSNGHCTGGGSSGKGSMTNGHTNGYLTNGHATDGGDGNQSSIGSMSEMCFYCFEVLHRELNQLEEPRTPSFTNDP